MHLLRLRYVCRKKSLKNLDGRLIGRPFFMKFDIITIFPDLFKGFLSESLLARAQKKKLISIKTHNLRRWTTDNHKTVDGRPYGGGAGMILKIEPVYKAVRSLISNSKFLISNPGIVHFFRGTKEDARKLLDMGFYFTFGGVITFVRDYDEIVKCIPMDRILSETDAPYVTPAPYRGKSFGGTQGKRNEPAYVIEVVKKLAELKGVSVEDVKDKIWENARRVFDFLS